MKHTEHKKGTAKSSFVQAVLLVVFFVLAFLGYKVLKGGGFTGGLNSFVNMDAPNFRPLESMKEEEKVALQKSFGGFWVYATNDTSAAIQKHDCLELRDNGIIWEVIHWRVAYPTGDTASYYHVRYGYLKPYSIAADERTIVCEVRTLRQVYIYNNDTCFGHSQVDELWNARKEDSLFILNRKRYTPYKGELSQFFPDTMIDLIDKLLLNECHHTLNLSYLVKEKLEDCYQNSESTRTCDRSAIKRAVNEYFKAAYVDELFPALPYFPSLPESTRLPFALHFDGKATLELSKNHRVQAHHVEGLIFKEFESWPFPRCDSKDSPTIDFTLQLLAP